MVQLWFIVLIDNGFISSIEKYLLLSYPVLRHHANLLEHEVNTDFKNLERLSCRSGRLTVNATASISTWGV